MGVREITADEASKRRAKAMANASPPSSGVLRDFAEGIATAGGNAFDFFNKYSGYSDSPAQEAIPHPPVLGPLADQISEATAENPTRARAAGSGTGGALMSMPVIAATGGLTAPVAVSSLVGGAGGGLASDEARRRGYGPFGQFVAGFAGDLGTSLLTRGAIAAPGALYDAISPTRRAGQYVAPLALGEETADQAATGLKGAFAEGKEDVDKLWDAYRSVPTQARTSAQPFHDLAASQAVETGLKPSDLPEIASRVPKILGDDVGVEDVNRVLKTVASTQIDDAATDNAKRLAGQFRQTAEGALDEIEALSKSDEAAVSALRSARKASREFAQAFPDDSTLYKAFISKKAADEPQEAFVRLLNSPKRETEMGLVMKATAGNREAQRGVRRAVVQAVMGNSEEVAAQAPTAALRRLDKYEGAARAALGDDGFDHFRKLLAEQATANRERGFVWRWLAGRGNPAKGMAAGTVLGGQIAGSEGATLGMAAGGALDLLAQRLSPRAVREIAINSLYDRTLYRQVTRPAPEGVKAAEWAATMVGSLVRRGVITKAESEGQE